MVVGVKDSDMDDSDAYVIEDTVVDCALVCHINILCVMHHRRKSSSQWNPTEPDSNVPTKSGS